MAKAKALQEAIDNLTQGLFGRTNDGAACVTCGSLKVRSIDFKDNLSRKEFGISGLCQKCQDNIFCDFSE